MKRFYRLGMIGFVSCLCLLGALTACRGKRDQGASRVNNDAHGTIRIASPRGPTAALLERMGRLWSSEFGTGIDVVPYQANKGPQDAGPCDLWIIGPAQMPQYAAANELLPVPSDLLTPGDSYAWDSLLPLFRNKLLIWNEKAFALPLLEEPLFCFYRTDLLNDPALLARFERSHHRRLIRPETWDQFVEIAEFFNAHNRPGASGRSHSLPSLPQNDDALDWEFYSLATPYARRAAKEDEPGSTSDNTLLSFHYDLQTGAIRINTPGFVHALEVMQKLQKCRPARTEIESAMAFQRGEAVLCLASPTWIPRFNVDKRIRGKFAFWTMPGSQLVFDFRTGKPMRVNEVNYVPYLGASGALMVVPRSSSRANDAFAFASFLSNPVISREIVTEPEWGGGAYRREHLESRVGWQAFETAAGGPELLVDCIRRTVAYNQIKNPVVRLRIPDQASHMKALDAELRLALAGNKTAKRALDDAAARWRQLDAEKAEAQRRLDYRLSLSLAR
jgi:multiple sugar transport system substrate-binding protein